MVLRVRRPLPPFSGVLWLAPFILVSLISSLLADHCLGFSETLRLFRIGFVLLYPVPDRSTGVVGLRGWNGAGATLQALMGVLEVATGRTGTWAFSAWAPTSKTRRP